jgi:hypothetical protein
MRFEVDWPHICGLRDGLEYSELVGDRFKDLRRRNLHFPAAKMLAIKKTGMSADRDSSCASSPNALAHRIGIAGVKARGDVGGRDKVEQLVVMPGSLAKVGIQIYEKITQWCS